MTASMKFFINGQPGVFLDLPVADDLTETEYFAIADANKDETKEYVQIYVEFNVTPPRENLIIHQA